MASNTARPDRAASSGARRTVSAAGRAAALAAVTLAGVALAPTDARSAAAAEVARYADGTWAVAADDAHVYLGHGPRVLVVPRDRLPAGPPVASIGPLPGGVAALGRVGDELLATLDGAPGVWRFDVAVPGDPRPRPPLGPAPGGAAAGGRIVVDGLRAYVGLGAGGAVGLVEPGSDGSLGWGAVLRLPAAPGGGPAAFAADGPVLAVATADGASVELWDIANPDRPRLDGSVVVGSADPQRPERVAALALSGGRLYAQIAAGPSLGEFWRLVTVDARNRHAPRITDRFDAPPIIHSAPGGLLVVGADLAALTRTRWGPNPLRFFDLADPARPTSGIEVPVGLGLALARAGGDVVVADHEDAGLHVVGRGPGGGWERRGYLDVLGGVTALAAGDGTFEALDVGGGAPRLHVLDAARPADGPVAQLEAPADAVRVLRDGARRLVLGYGGAVSVVRTVDGQPAVVGRGALGVQTADVRYAAALDGAVLVPRRGGVDVVALADDGTIRIPSSLGVAASSGQRTLLATAAGRAAVVVTTLGHVAPSAGLALYDLADVQRPVQLGAAAFDDEVAGAVVDGDLVAVVFARSRQVVAFAADGGSLREVGRAALPGDGTPTSVVGLGRTVYVAGGGRIRRIDLADAAQPRLSDVAAIDGDLAAAAPVPGGPGTALYVLAPRALGFARSVVVLHDGAAPRPPTATATPDARPTRPSRPLPTLTPAAEASASPPAMLAPLYLPFGRRGR